MTYFGGDIPEEHRKLIEELTLLENWFHKYGEELPVLSIAKGFVSMSYDWYSMDLEEEGERLLKKADKYCPGYFTGPIYSHISRDEEYAILVDGLKRSIAIDTMSSLGFNQ